MRLPMWSEFTAYDGQRDVLEVPLYQSFLVVGPPGSGKTVLALARAQMMADNDLSVQIATYNRMLRRLMQTLSPDIQSSTMHAFARKDYCSRTGDLSVPHYRASEYAYQWDTICRNLNALPAIGNRIHCVIFDEAQDLEIGAFTYTACVADTLNIFADTEQALTENFTSYQDIMKETGIKESIILSDNHRNCPEVARLAEHYHDGILPVATVERPHSGQKPRLWHARSISHASQFVSNWFINRSGTIGVIVKENEYGMKIQDALQRRLPDRRIDRYTSNERNEASIDLLEPGITILNQRSAKGQEFDSVFILQIEKFIPCTSATDRRTMYMMCSRARDFLFLVHCHGELSPAAENSLPGPDVLERA